MQQLTDDTIPSDGPLLGSSCADDGEISLLAALIAQELPTRYHLLGYLGRGAFATVWRAFDRLNNRPIALKRFHTSAGRRRGDYYKELGALFLIDHAQIVRLFDVLETEQGQRYLMLEYCPGGTLRQALVEATRRQRRWALRHAGRIGWQVALGLEAAHRAGLVHRDLKPDNVLFVQRDEENELFSLKIADFGMARGQNRAERCPEIGGGVSGSPAYMAPEQFTNLWTPASDLYSLGVMLYELVHDRLPFRGGPEELGRQHLYETPAINAALPAPWPDLLRRLLAKEPHRRPTATELAIRLSPCDKDQEEPMPRSDREGVIQTDAKHFQSALCALAEFTSNTAPRPAAPVRPAAVEHPSAAEAERRTAELLAKLFPAGAGENAPPAEPPAAPVAPPARPPARPDTWSNSDDLFGSPAWDHEDAAGVSDYMPAAFALPEAEASVVAPEPSPLLPTESTLTPAQASANDVFSNFQW